MLKLSALLFCLIKEKGLIVFIAWLCLTFKRVSAVLNLL